MNISSLNSIAQLTANTQLAASREQASAAEGGRLQQRDQQPGALRQAFDEFVGQTFYTQLLAAMRETVGRPAYFHGGRAEEVFQSQLDQVLSERLSAASAETFTEPMFELFQLKRP